MYVKLLPKIFFMSPDIRLFPGVLLMLPGYGLRLEAESPPCIRHNNNNCTVLPFCMNRLEDANFQNLVRGPFFSADLYDHSSTLSLKGSSPNPHRRLSICIPI